MSFAGHASTLACSNERSAIVEVGEGAASHRLAFDGEDEVEDGREIAGTHLRHAYSARSIFGETY
jgi:hypothetical protein